LPFIDFSTDASKNEFEKKSNEPINTTRALFLACNALINNVNLPTECGYY